VRHELDLQLQVMRLPAAYSCPYRKQDGSRLSLRHELELQVRDGPAAPTRAPTGRMVALAACATDEWPSACSMQEWSRFRQVQLQLEEMVALTTRAAHSPSFLLLRACGKKPDSHKHACLQWGW
jgi:hypothetical protein